MKNNSSRSFFSFLPALCTCGVAAVLAGCSSNWVAGDAPEVPSGAYIGDRVVTNSDTLAAEKAASELAKNASVEEVSPLRPMDENNTTASSDPVFSVPENSTLTHTVKKGETWDSLSQLYGVPQQDIAAASKLDTTKPLQPGDVITIPEDAISAQPIEQVSMEEPAPAQKASASDEKAVEPAEQKQADEKAMRIHEIKKGDTLGHLAISYRVYPSEIAKANNMDVNAMLRIGQKLKIPPENPNYKAPQKKKSAAPAKKSTKNTQKTAATAAAAPVVKNTASGKSTPAPVTPVSPKPVSAAPAPVTEKTTPVPPKGPSATTTEEDDDLELLNDDSESDTKQTTQDTTAKSSDVTTNTYSVHTSSEMTLRQYSKINPDVSLEQLLKLNPKFGADDVMPVNTEVLFPLE